MKTSFEPEKIVFIGGGAHLTAVRDILPAHLQGRIIGYVDRSPTAADMQYLGSDREFIGRFPPEVGIGLVMGIGIDVRLRGRLFEEYKNKGYHFLTTVHSSAIISPTSRLAEGIVVFPSVVVGAGVQLQENVCLYSASVVEHGTVVGAHSYLSPAVALGGNCHIGRGCLLGINSTLIEGITLAAHVTVGAGAVVIGDFIQVGAVIAGVPARILRGADEEVC